ncbi:MAG: CoA transferase [Acetobacter sp.]|uniref:CaiB/BaiF CoA transferase family protein n=1 Tax=Acetobacter sp. TaxID=440 RepID=UPI0039E87E98
MQDTRPAKPLSQSELPGATLPGAEPLGAGPAGSDAMGHEGPLAGVRIVDFSRVLSGPYCTALLADLGAEVIKVETPAGDDYRHVAPFERGESALFTQVNRGKKSVVLDLKTPEGVQAAYALARTADAVVENFRPGVADRLGIGWDTLHAINPSLIYLSISGFGQTGPDAAKPAYDVIIQGLCGIMDVTGQPDGPPTLVGEALADVVAGLFGSWALLAALAGRERKARVQSGGQGTAMQGMAAPPGGRRIDLSMFEAMMSLMVTSTSTYLFSGQVPGRVGNRHPLSSPFGFYRAADGYFSIAVLNNRLFRAVCETIGAEDLMDDSRFASDSARSQHDHVLRERIEAWSASRSVADILACLDRAGVPGGPMQTVDQALSCPQAQARNMVLPIDDPRLPDARLVRQPAIFDGHVPAHLSRAPALGEHTEEILKSLGVVGDSSASA